jgi:hypothetical protein
LEVHELPLLVSVDPFRMERCAVVLLPQNIAKKAQAGTRGHSLEGLSAQARHSSLENAIKVALAWPILASTAVRSLDLQFHTVKGFGKNSSVGRLDIPLETI